MWVEVDVLKVPAFPEADVAATAANDEVAPDEPAEAAGEGVLRLTWLWIYLLAPALVTVLTAFLRSLVVHQAEAAEPAADEAAYHGEPAPEVGAKRRLLTRITVKYAAVSRVERRRSAFTCHARTRQC